MSSQPTAEAGAADPEREPTPAHPEEPPASDAEFGEGARPARSADLADAAAQVGRVLGRIGRVIWRILKGLAFAVTWFVLGLIGAIRRFRTPLVVLPLIAVIVGAGAIGASMLSRALPDKAEPAPPVTCWSGASLPVAECGRPFGAKGLQWVFPDFRPRDARCEHTSPTRGRRDVLPSVWRCSIPFHGTPVTYTYTQYAGTKKTVAAVRQQLGRVKPVSIRNGERLLWAAKDADADGQFTLVEAYARYPYAVTVSAPTAAVRNAALDAAVKFRKESSVVVQPDTVRPRKPSR